MARKRYTTEQIISLFREAEVRLEQGQRVSEGIMKAARIANANKPRKLKSIKS